MSLALPLSAVIHNMSVDKCVDMCTEKVRRPLPLWVMCARERVVMPDICSRKNPWPSCQVIDVTAATRPLSSPSMSRRTRTCVSTAVKAKSSRTVAMTSTSWCTRHRFKVATDGRHVSLFFLLNSPLWSRDVAFRDACWEIGRLKSYCSPLRDLNVQQTNPCVGGKCCVISLKKKKKLIKLYSYFFFFSF